MYVTMYLNARFDTQDASGEIKCITDIPVISAISRSHRYVTDLRSAVSDYLFSLFSHSSVLMFLCTCQSVSHILATSSCTLVGLERTRERSHQSAEIRRIGTCAVAVCHPCMVHDDDSPHMFLFLVSCFFSCFRECYPKTDSASTAWNV